MTIRSIIHNKDGWFWGKVSTQLPGPAASLWSTCQAGGSGAWQRLKAGATPKRLCFCILHPWCILDLLLFPSILVISWFYALVSGVLLVATWGLQFGHRSRPRMPRMPPHFVWWFAVSSRFKAWTKIANIPTAVRTAQVHPNWQVPKSMNIAVGDTWMD